MDNLDDAIAKLRIAAESLRQAADALQQGAHSRAAAATDALQQAAHAQAADGAAIAGHAAAAGGVSPFMYELAIFAMAVFVGYYVVWSVTPALHTPLMSVTNAISSVIVVGALLSVGVATIDSGSGFARLVGFVALALASVNIFGGFMVTERMLAMYKKKG